MRNTGVEETQAGIKIAGRNINNLRYEDDITLMAESFSPYVLLFHCYIKLNGNIMLKIVNWPHFLLVN